MVVEGDGLDAPDEVDLDSDAPYDLEHEACRDPVERQRELNDNLALIRILDDMSPFGEFGAFASEPLLYNGRARRMTLLNFVAFCLARDGTSAAALAATIQPRTLDPSSNSTIVTAATATATATGNTLVLHVARSTGSTPSDERARVCELLSALKRAWRAPTYSHMQLVLGHVMQMTGRTLRRRLTKFRRALRDLQGAGGFVDAVDAWGREEASPDVVRWMETWGCESQTAALKDVFLQLAASAEAHDFEAPDLMDEQGQFRLYHSYFFPIAVLLGSHFLHEVEFGQTGHPIHLVLRVRRLRRRCIKLRWYEIGVHLLCTYARDATRRILGAEAFARFLNRDDDDGFSINWLETPGAVSPPMYRGYNSPQDALQSMLASISDGSDDDDEPFACTIAHKPSAAACWTTTCTPVYHPELQVIDHLRQCNMGPSPAYVGSSQLACRACKFYVDQLDGGKWMLHTSGLDTMDLDVPEDWLIPPSETGLVCATIIRDEAARLALREDNFQRIAWETRMAAEGMCPDDLDGAGTEEEGSSIIPSIDTKDDTRLSAERCP
ncbi:hypothetical protein K439DRAFT_1640621 [Ramaria rubella]|nr:hypothetical protein K439DRAFT_1640621 [Ramaria rubella]